MAELLAKIMSRGAFILQKKGLMAPMKINGRQVAVKYTSPFAKTQNTDDVIALQETMQICAPLGPEALQMGLKVKDIYGWVGRKKGLPESLIMTDADRTELTKKTTQAAQAAQQNQVQQNAAMNPQPPNTTNQAPPPLSAA
jgi:hypothetical protein